MHSSNFEIEGNRAAEGGEILVSIAALVTEGRIPLKSTAKTCGFYEGPHCKNSTEHNCDSTNPLCCKYEKVRSDVLGLWKKRIPLCVEVVLTPGCSCETETDQSCSTSESDSAESTDSDFLLEQWLIAINHRRIHDDTYINLVQLINAVRSQLHFSQISAWLTAPENSSKISKNNIAYRLSFPGETIQMSNFRNQASKHDFPITDIGNGLVLQVTLFSLPRLADIPTIKCNKCEQDLNIPLDKIQIGAKKQMGIVNDRMRVTCTLKGKHRCEDYDEFDSRLKNDINIAKYKRVCNPNYSESRPSTSKYVEPFLSFDQKSQYNTYYSKLGFETQTRLNANDKRNSNSTVEQKIKNLKLDPNASNVIIQKKGSKSNININDLNDEQPSKGDILLNAILRSSHLKPSSSDRSHSKAEPSANFKCEEDKNVSCDFKCVQKFGEINPNSCINAMKDESDTNKSLCDNLSASGDIFSIKDKSKINIYLDKHCDSPIPKFKYKRIRDISNVDHNQLVRLKARQKISFSDCCDYNESNKRESCDETSGKYDKSLLKFENNGGSDIPSASEQAQFRKSLDNATTMVFHARTGLPLTSSPAPIRRGKSCFDFDSSINSVSAIGNALCSLTSDDESESDSSAVSPCSPETYALPNKELLPIKCYKRKHPNNLLGTFEESVLNGRLEPASTVHGFTAELGASGSFVPKHLVVPVTVFFYSLGDNEKVSSPYLGHINLGRKGYHVPKSGTVQVTLFNPLGTVVKMFVVMYDLNEMPPNTQTFIRQRTLYMPTNCHDKNLEWGTKWLRYLIHLRFMSSKSGRTYLHSDIRMIIFRKFDLDTATAHDIEKSYELRSFTHMPANPRFSPRKKV